MRDKIKAIQELLDPKSAVICLSRPNHLYFTGLDTEDGVLLITKKTAQFLIDFRYFEMACNKIRSCDVILLTDLSKQLIHYTEGVETVYLDTSYISLKQYYTYSKLLLNHAVVLDDDRFDREILQLRSIKTKDEYNKIADAQQITEDTFYYILNHIQPGRTEREIMLDMEFYLRQQGSDGIAFDFIVVSGKNTALPHGVPSDKVIEDGDLVTLDFGAVVEGYRSDMTRTVAVGHIGEEERYVYNTVLEAQTLAINAIKADMSCSEIDFIARKYIYDKGYNGCFGHGLGHSVGVEIHESPSLSPKDLSVLKAGMILTVEPGIYLPGRFGVRIEDMVCVNQSYCDNMTDVTKELIIL